MVRFVNQESTRSTTTLGKNDGEDVEKRDGECGPALEQFASRESPLVKRKGMGREKYPRVGASLLTHPRSVVLAYRAASMIPEKRSQSIPTDKEEAPGRACQKMLLIGKTIRSALFLKNAA